MKIDCERVIYSLTLQMMLPFFLLIGQIIYICGEVIVLSGNSYRSITNVNRKKYICLSNDDGGALIWNDEFADVKVKENLKFHSMNIINDIWINCKMNANSSCLESWSRVNWTLTNSEKTFMGPVFDQRWEDFQEYQAPLDKTPHFKLPYRFPSVGALSFSFRSMATMGFLICNLLLDKGNYNKRYNDTLCFTTKIQSRIQDNESSVHVQICKQQNHRQCSYSKIHKIRTPVASMVWHTFTILWDFSEGFRTFSIYDIENRIFTFEDKEKAYSISNDTFFIFLGTPLMQFDIVTQALFRFHVYDFLYTADETAILTSPVFKHSTQKIQCIQLLMGLCADCNANIVMIDSTTREILKSVTANGSTNAASHGLPMWQLIKLDGNFSTVNYSGSVQIQVIPKLTAPSHNSLWAIANVRQCLTKENWRKGVISIPITGDWAFEVTCQKLFYDKNVIVDPMEGTNKNDINLDICPKGRIGPGCLFSCKRDLSSFNCIGTKICSTHGCTCSAGYRGHTCSVLCDNNWYGYNCKNKCGSCKPSDNFGYKCNKVTGECIDGCVNSSKVIFVPPLCHTGIKPRAPVIVSTTSKSIGTKIFILWKKEHDQKLLNYSFTIKGENNYTLSQPWSRVFQNMTLLTGYFDQLNPGSIYFVKCSLLVENKTVDSDWQIVETDCEPATSFSIRSTENSVIINQLITSDQLCPTRWYYLSLDNRTTGKNIFYARILKFPYKVSSLPPYAFFNVTVFFHPQSTPSQQTVLLATYIRTLQSVSTRGMDIQYFVNSSTQITLTWKSPNHLNTLLYIISLKINFYYGCEDLNKHSTVPSIIYISTKETAHTFQGLHPYASYTAQLTAHVPPNSSYDTEITFNTPETDTPTEIFTELTVQNWTVSWQSPTDCSTILGPLMARIKINGVKSTAKNYTASEVTLRTYLDLTTINSPLLSAEQYRARVYVIRESNGTENSSAYVERYFKTPSIAPPVIKNLEVIEIDTRQKLLNTMLHLRWVTRVSSEKRQFRYYNVTSSYNSLQINKNEFCDLWDDRICANFPLYKNHSNIQVFEINENGTELSPPTIVHQEMLTTTKPDKPANITHTLLNNGIVDLVWYHPWRTSRHLQCFVIEVKQDTSYLKNRVVRATTKKLEYPVEEYKRNYAERLYLFPSTWYRIYIRSVTITNETSLYNYINVQTPSTASFDGVLRVTPHEFNSTISLNVPHILNDTYDSVMHIIVKGPNRCNNYSSIPVTLQMLANMTTDDAWQAAEISVDEMARDNFTFIVGDNETYGGARNCPLQLNRQYEIIVILTEQSSIYRISNEAIILRTSTSIEKVSDSSVPYKMWLVPLIILLLLFISTLLAISYIHWRKRHKIKRQIMSENKIELRENADKTTVFDS